MYTKEELFEIINCVNSDAFTPLHLASSEGHPHLIEILVQFGAQIDARNNNFRTPLHIACLRGHLTVIKALVTAGADINAKDIDNNTPTHFCSEYGHSFCLKFILKKDEYDKRRVDQRIQFLKFVAVLALPRQVVTNLHNHDLFGFVFVLSQQNNMQYAES